MLGQSFISTANFLLKTYVQFKYYIMCIAQLYLPCF
jgi:hypothetical protein